MQDSADFWTILDDIGQVAAEVPCYFEDCREFVSIYKAPWAGILGVEKRFHYFKGAEYLYRICRFRVRSKVVVNDVDVASNDLLDMQQIYVATKSAVIFNVSLWISDLSTVGRPADCSIPV